MVDRQVVNARIKYQEADYFLEQMKATKESIVFEFNLSAFLAAARSITFYLQKEFSGDEVFDKWYSKTTSEMTDTFDYLKEARNFSQKKGYPYSRVSDIVYHDSMTDLGKKRDNYFQSAPRKDIPEEVLNSPIYEVCEKYLENLDEVLSEWESYLEGEIDTTELEGEGG